MSIVDVARIADVSVATVSRVLNAPASVRAETADRVHAAMQRLGYSLPTVRRGPKIGPRATGTAQNNRVSGNQFTNVQTTGNAGGILVYNAGQISILSNVVYNNDTNITIDGGQGPGGVLLDGSNGTNVAGNQVYNSTYFDGIDLVDGVTRVYVTWNYVYGNVVDGIFIDANSGGNYLTNNLLQNNANYDIEDVTYSPSNGQGSPTFGTQNFYYKDQFGTTNDPSLVSTSYN